MAGLLSKHEELLRLIPDLQCHNCKNVPGPTQKNRYSCTKAAHTLCEEHKTKCLCGSKVGKTPSPVIANLLQNLPWMCQNYKTGCRESKMNGEDLEHHQGKCIYRQVFCPNLSKFGCEGKVLFKDVIDHIETTHKVIAKVKSETVIGKKDTFLNKKISSNDFLSGTQWHPAKLVTSCGAIFFFLGKIEKDTIYLWLVFMGSSDESKKYSYTCSISNQIGQTFLYSGPVHTLDDNCCDIIAYGSLLTIAVSAAKRSLNEEKQLECKITIKNLKEETKDDDMESGVSEGE